MIIRRLVSLSVLAAVTLSLYALAPALFVLALIGSALPRFRTLPHALGFALGFLFYECTGVLRLGWLWLRYRGCRIIDDLICCVTGCISRLNCCLTNGCCSSCGISWLTLAKMHSRCCSWGDGRYGVSMA